MEREDRGLGETREKGSTRVIGTAESRGGNTLEGGGHAEEQTQKSQPKRKYGKGGQRGRGLKVTKRSLQT